MPPVTSADFEDAAVEHPARAPAITIVNKDKHGLKVFIILLFGMG
jgi:hypothetical protein